MTTPKFSTHRCVATVLLLLIAVVVTNNRANAWTITSSQSTLNGSNNSYRCTARSTSIVRRQANVATEILLSQIKDEEDAVRKSESVTSSTPTSPSTKSNAKGKRRLPRSERKALERERKAENAIKSGNNKGKKKKDYKLHSTAVSQLTASSTADDVVKAIKRAQKQHDHHDLRVIANFLIDECDVGFAYGYRGSLLARLAVAALRWENHNVARRAIEIRRLEYRASMRPMESAAIIRGLLRVHNVTDALDMIADELSLPMEVGITFSMEC